MNTKPHTYARSGGVGLVWLCVRVGRYPSSSLRKRCERIRVSGGRGKTGMARVAGCGSHAESSTQPSLDERMTAAREAWQYRPTQQPFSSTCAAYGFLGTLTCNRYWRPSHSRRLAQIPELTLSMLIETAIPCPHPETLPNVKLFARPWAVNETYVLRWR